MSLLEETTFHERHQSIAIACLIAQIVSLLLFGITKSYLNSKPLGMQSLYDTFSKLCIDCFLIMGIVNIVITIAFLFFGPINHDVSLVLTLVSYITMLTSFICLFCVQIVRYLYLTYPVVLDYYDENMTISIFKHTVFVAA